MAINVNLTAKEIAILMIIGGVLAAVIVGVATGSFSLDSIGTIVSVLLGAAGTVGTGAYIATKKV